MPKRYGVNVIRTIALDQTVFVKANSRADAIQKVQSQHDEGKGGDPYVEFKRAKGVFAKDDVEGGEINEEFEIEDAWEDE